MEVQRLENNSHICFEKMPFGAKVETFLAIDFETAKDLDPCQIGIAIVENREIIGTVNKLIRPRGNEYNPYTIAVHHITPDRTENAPDFPEVWQEIASLFEGAYIIAHNARFDMSVLQSTLESYGLPLPAIKGYLCTCDLNNREGLELSCARYGISLSKHHDGEDDAINCAKLYLAYLRGETPLSNDQLPSHLLEPKKKEHDWASAFEGHDSLKGDVLKKDLSGADPANPFYDRKVVITGIFPIDRKELAQQIKNMGADIDSSVGKKLNYLIIGKDPGSSKVKKVDEMIASGLDVRKIYKEDLDKILAGQDYEKYHTELLAPKSKK